jgi:hypothetical protein
VTRTKRCSAWKLGRGSRGDDEDWVSEERQLKTVCVSIDKSTQSLRAKQAEIDPTHWDHLSGAARPHRDKL